jgi:hypothetical protein
MPVVIEHGGRKMRGWYRLSGDTLVVSGENYLGERRTVVGEAADPGRCQEIARELLRALAAANAPA